MNLHLVNQTEYLTSHDEEYSFENMSPTISFFNLMDELFVMLEKINRFIEDFQKDDQTLTIKESNVIAHMFFGINSIKNNVLDFATVLEKAER